MPSTVEIGRVWHIDGASHQEVSAPRSSVTACSAPRIWNGGDRVDLGPDRAPVQDVGIPTNWTPVVFPRYGQRERSTICRARRHAEARPQLRLGAGFCAVNGVVSNGFATLTPRHVT